MPRVCRNISVETLMDAFLIQAPFLRDVATTATVPTRTAAIIRGAVAGTRRQASA